MREFKKGKLHSGGSGKIVKNAKQAIAIALSEAGKKAGDQGAISDAAKRRFGK